MASPIITTTEFLREYNIQISWVYMFFEKLQIYNVKFLLLFQAVWFLVWASQKASWGRAWLKLKNGQHVCAWPGLQGWPCRREGTTLLLEHGGCSSALTSQEAEIPDHPGQRCIKNVAQQRRRASRLWMECLCKPFSAACPKHEQLYKVFQHHQQRRSRRQSTQADHCARPGSGIEFSNRFGQFPSFLFCFLSRDGNVSFNEVFSGFFLDILKGKKVKQKKLKQIFQKTQANNSKTLYFAN